MDTYSGAIAVVIVGALIAAAFSIGQGDTRARIQHECKSFNATVINAEKFRCEFVKESKE